MRGKTDVNLFYVNSKVFEWSKIYYVAIRRFTNNSFDETAKFIKYFPYVFATDSWYISQELWITQETKVVRHTVAHCRECVTAEATLKGKKHWTSPTQVKHTATFPLKDACFSFMFLSKISKMNWKNSDLNEMTKTIKRYLPLVHIL